MTKPTTAKIFAKNLNRYLEKSGRTQKEIAEEIGVSPAAFNWWVKGNRYPRMDKVEKLADYFGCTLSDLIEEQEAESPIDIKSAIRTLPKDVQEIVNLCMEVPGLAGDLKMIAQTIINRRAEK